MRNGRNGASFSLEEAYKAATTVEGRYKLLCDAVAIGQPGAQSLLKEFVSKHGRPDLPSYGRVEDSLRITLREADGSYDYAVGKRAVLAKDGNALTERERKKRKEAYRQTAIFQYTRLVVLAESVGLWGIVLYASERLAELNGTEKPPADPLKEAKKITRRALIKNGVESGKETDSGGSLD